MNEELPYEKKIARDMELYGITIRDDEEGIVQIYQLYSQKESEYGILESEYGISDRKKTTYSDIAEIRYNPETGIILPISPEEVRRRREIPEIYENIIKPIEILIGEMNGDLYDTVFDPIMEASNRVERNDTIGCKTGYFSPSIPDNELSKIVKDAINSLEKLKH
ncbi:MAG: hypothetical protein KAT28_05525 [Candidatus Aenigmarchaeota archaeon]|nr:hypothetical protein [Candidatus Aenigmarchaeota archaeon]